MGIGWVMAALMNGGLNSCFLMLSLGSEMSFCINERMVLAALWGPARQGAGLGH